MFGYLRVKAMDPVLENLASAVADSEDLESLVRPLLEILQSITGLESTYLTEIHSGEGVQKILFSHNEQGLQIPEGRSVEWDDSLCQRAIRDECFHANDVSERWCDSQAARALGIEAYLGHPVRLGCGELYGTLCGASSAAVRVDEDARKLLALFSDLIARQVERERLLARLRLENADYQRHALTDPLTGIPNRRAAMQELVRTLQIARRSGSIVQVAFIDLDGFKYINDTHGHDAGDRFLLQIAASLRNGMRQSDYVARLGGDEFLALGLDNSADPHSGRDIFRDRVQALTRGNFSIGETSIEYLGASVGVVSSAQDDESAEALLARADQAMYQVKRLRKAQR